MTEMYGQDEMNIPYSVRVFYDWEIAIVGNVYAFRSDHKIFGFITYKIRERERERKEKRRRSKNNVNL